MASINTNAALQLLILLVKAIIPAIVSEFVAMWAQKRFQVETKYHATVSYWKDYQERLVKLHKSGKVPTAPSAYKETVLEKVNRETSGHPMLSSSNEKYQMERQRYNLAEISVRVASAVVMIIGYRLLIQPYKGQVVARLPFEPPATMGLRSFAHSTLKDPHVRDASAVFIYMLISMGARPMLLKLFNIQAIKYQVPDL